MDVKLNSRVADALLSIPKHDESAFCVVSGERVNPVLYASRFNVLPDGGPQVYALKAAQLKHFSAFGVRSTFCYTLCVSPMAPMQVHALVLNTAAGSDPLVQLHAPEFAHEAGGYLVIHFIDEDAMHKFVSGM
jgi:hypothetical protein